MTDCPWDLNGDGVVDDDDVQWLVDHWGPCVPGSKGDFNGDGVINNDDFVELAGHYGPCPGVTPPTEITCNSPTPHYSSGCALLQHYDPDDNCEISPEYYSSALMDERNGLITQEEFDFVRKVYREHDWSINDVCPGCCSPLPPPIVCTPGETVCQSDAYLKTCKPDGTGWSLSVCYSGTVCKDGKCVPVVTPPPTPPPNMETRIMSLAEGRHTIQVSLNGYNTLNATIDATATGVTCVSVVGGACGGTGLPRVSTSGLTVSTYLKEGSTATTRCTWIETQNTSAVAFISDMVLAYNNLKNIGFTPSAAEIGDGVLMYSNLGTPASLWGC